MKKIVFGVGLVSLALAIAFGGGLKADEDFDFGHFRFFPGNLVVSRSVYDNDADNVPAGTILPPNCPAASGGCNTTATPYGGLKYPDVFDNDLYDAAFGITSKIYLDQMTPFGWQLGSLEVPNSSQKGIKSTSDQLVTSFSSKSEIALNLSTDKKYLTFMGYVAPIDALDVSNANAPGTATVTGIDPSNPDGAIGLRAVAEVDQEGHFEFTETNAYTGNNGRAAIYNHGKGVDFYYTAGNAGNGGTPQPNGVLVGAGAQMMSPAEKPEKEQTPGVPTPVGSFNLLEIKGAKADKLGKDDNYRGMTIYDNVLYYTKGSGSNGVNTLYFVDTVGTACKKDGSTTTSGSGLPVTGATLPTMPISVNLPTLQMTGLTPNLCILAGFPTVSNKTLPSTVNPAFPFGVWFADANTVYVADEGDGYNKATDLYTHAAGQVVDQVKNGPTPTAGLQKWVFNPAKQLWQLAYTLQTGLDLGTAYTVPGYPTGNNAAQVSKTNPNGLPWSPATDGLRNITGRVDWDGKVTIWGITSTVSGSGDTGADPNRLVAITDVLANTNTGVAAAETFHTLRTAEFAEVLRGVSFTPGTGVADDDDHDGDDQGRGRDKH